ncbi:MAG: hypothetical protein R2874_03120 [Desulfobacterales bacterium]
MKLIDEFGAERARKAAMTYRIIMDKHACLNPNSHRAFIWIGTRMDDLIHNSPPLIGDLRLIHMCSQSDGACVIIFASEERQKKIGKTPGVGPGPYYRPPGRNPWICITTIIPTDHSPVRCPAALPKKWHRQSPDYFDVFEMYDPSAWWGVDRCGNFFCWKATNI